MIFFHTYDFSSNISARVLPTERTVANYSLKLIGIKWRRYVHDMLNFPDDCERFKRICTITYLKYVLVV